MRIGNEGLKYEMRDGQNTRGCLLLTRTSLLLAASSLWNHKIRQKESAHWFISSTEAREKVKTVYKQPEGRDFMPNTHTLHGQMCFPQKWHLITGFRANDVAYWGTLKQQPIARTPHSIPMIYVRARNYTATDICQWYTNHWRFGHSGILDMTNGSAESWQQRRVDLCFQDSVVVIGLTRPVISNANYIAVKLFLGHVYFEVPTVFENNLRFHVWNVWLQQQRRWHRLHFPRFSFDLSLSWGHSISTSLFISLQKEDLRRHNFKGKRSRYWSRTSSRICLCWKERF